LIGCLKARLEVALVSGLKIGVAEQANVLDAVQ
jgi:hypothetical protein